MPPGAVMKHRIPITAFSGLTVCDAFIGCQGPPEWLHATGACLPAGLPACLARHSSRAHNKTTECGGHCSSRVGQMNYCQIASEASNTNVIECGAVSPHATPDEASHNVVSSYLGRSSSLTCRSQIIVRQTGTVASFIRHSFN